MINTLYSKDSSRKVSTALKAQMESGDFKKRNLHEIIDLGVMVPAETIVQRALEEPIFAKDSSKIAI